MRINQSIRLFSPLRKKRKKLWAERSRAVGLGQRFAKQVLTCRAMDPAYGIEPVIKTGEMSFPGQIVIPTPEVTVSEAQNMQEAHEFCIWSDGSRLPSQCAGAGIAYRANTGKAEWEIQRTYLGKNKEILDAELWAISDALKLALKESRTQMTQVTVRRDSQKALKRLEKPTTSEPGQAIALQIQLRTQELARKRTRVKVQWIPGHKGPEENEKADEAANAAAEGRGRKTVQGTLELTIPPDHLRTKLSSVDVVSNKRDHALYVYKCECS